LPSVRQLAENGLLKAAATVIARVAAGRIFNRQRKISYQYPLTVVPGMALRAWLPNAGNMEIGQFHPTGVFTERWPGTHRAYRTITQRKKGR